MCSSQCLWLCCGQDGARLSLGPVSGSRLPHREEEEEAGAEDQEPDEEEPSFLLQVDEMEPVHQHVSHYQGQVMQISVCLWKCSGIKSS